MLFMKLANSRAMAEAKNAAGKAHQTTEPAQGNTCSARLPQQHGGTRRAVTSQPPMVTDSEWFGMSAEEQ